jgi:hypothetical protein
MTKLTKNFMIAAAALTLTATAVSAETLKAEIPFAFQVSGKVLPAGTYTVDSSKLRSTGIVPLRSTETNDAVLVSRIAANDPKAEWRADGKARLVFECGDTCTLVQIYSPSDAAAYGIAHPKSTNLNTRIAVIVMRSDKGD